MNGGAFANIPQAQVFSHTQATTYSYTNHTSTTGTIVVTPTGGHSLSVGNSGNLKFSTGNLFSASAGYTGAYTITAVNGTSTFTVGITGTALPATGTGAGFVDNSASTTTGLLGCIYANTSFSGSPGRIPVDTAVTSSNNGIWGTGTADPLIFPDTFSVRWTRQVLPQYSEDYTFVVNCEDAAKLWINGQPQVLRVAAAGNSAGTYSYNTSTGNTVVTHTNIPAGSFTVGETVRVDPSSGKLNSLPYADYVVTAVGPGTFTINNGAGAFATGTGNCNIEWLNKPIDWTSASNTGSDRYARISLVGGVRYDIRLDYFENTSTAKCQLSWYSPSQTKQIIPQARLFPANSTLQPANAVSATSVTAYAGGPFSYVIAGTNGGTFTVAGMPAWLNIAGNVLSGNPPAGVAADYQLLITITNSVGSGDSVVNLHVEDNTATPIVREYWSGVVGTTVATIPTTTAPSGTANLTSLEAPTDFGEDYGARIRGFLSAPTTGNYYFWIAGNNAAELWISNDADPVNAIKRVYVTTGTASQEWNAAGETHQKSPWLALEEGKKYYIEILHKAGTGVGDNLAVGWAKPGQSGSAPSQVVPGYALSTYIAPAPGSTPGTLYFSTMLAQAGAVGLTPNAPVNGVGTATLRVSENETVAILKFNHSGLTGSVTQKHIHADPYLTHPSQIIFDIDAPENPGDGLITSGPDAGGYQWTITDRGTLTAAEMREIIKQGKAYINLHTAINPTGEIRGNFTLAAGSRTFSPPPPPPSWSDDSNTDAGAARFLAQATFGPNIADITSLKTSSPGSYATRYEAWIEDQFLKPVSHQLPEVQARELSDANGGSQFSETLTFNAWWWNSIIGDDQLRQRVAYALSQIHVVSAQGPLDNRADALSYFYDNLADNAFGSFRTILETTTLLPAMGRYLDMLRNDKPDQSVGRIPNENYAREIKQLFSLGLNRMWPDGTLMLNSQDSPIDTYTQLEIVGFAHVFTGWDYGYDGAYRTALNAPTNWTRQMREVPARHYTGPKRILNNEVLPGLTSLGGQQVDPFATHNTTQYNDPAYQALPAQELAAAHDQLFNHPNVGPFVCRQLIQRLVTSHPSRDYLYRVVQKFNDNGSGVRGDMKAVVKAVLLDYEARSTANVTKPSYGKQREAVLRVAAAARAFRQGSGSGSYDQANAQTAAVGDHVIKISMANKFTGGNTVFLEFTHPPGVFVPGDTTPTSEAYTVLTTPAPNSSVFYVNAKEWTGVSTSNGQDNDGISGTYSQINPTTIRVSISSHWLPVGGKAYLDFEIPSGTAVPDGMYAATNIESAGAGGAYFDIAVSGTTGRSGRVRMVRFQGSFTVSNSNLAIPQERRITLDTTSGGIADHHLVATNPIFLNFTVGNPQPLDDELVVENVPDSNTFTVLTDLVGVGGGNDGDNGMWMFPLVSQPMARSGASGSVIGLSSTYNMGLTDADIDQTPLNSPTVFNFFLPDYKYPGALASQGITTPEFQDTAETSVVRQANFLFNGIFNPGNTNGISSFKSGTHALVLDLTPWMANATDIGLGAGPQTSQAWTNNANLPTLVSHLGTLLVPGGMPSNRRTIIEDFLTYERTISGITNGSNPCSIDTSASHNLTTGDYVTLSGITAGTFQIISDSSTVAINSTWKITVVDANTFTLDVVKLSGAETLSSARVSYVPYTNSAATDTNKRDRLRSILHLILTSPDYTIQR